MEDMMGKPLNGAGLEVLWELIKERDVNVTTGSYVGTGKAGSSNPNQIAVGFDAKFVVVVPAAISVNDGGGNNYSTFFGLLIPSQQVGMVKTVGGTTARILTATSGGGVVRWYTAGSAHSDTLAQMNQSGATYHYAAIG